MVARCRPRPPPPLPAGEHPTTRLCLRHIWSLRGSLAGARVVDYGAGSGVLAIAALLLGAQRVGVSGRV